LIECVFSTIAPGLSLPVKRFTVNRFTPALGRLQEKSSSPKKVGDRFQRVGYRLQPAGMRK
jgi:hypothetical protein